MLQNVCKKKKVRLVTVSEEQSDKGSKLANMIMISV